MGGATIIKGWLELDAIGSTHAPQVGGKAARLGELKRQGFAVPDGFVVTTALFGDAVAAEHAIEEALPRLGAGARVAVRSSAVAEDLDEASFAGQYETVLNVSGVADVVAALRKCWDSARTSRVADYAGRQAGGRAGPVAVLVQKMVEAESAGVAYSANPITGKRDEAVVSAVRGLGEGLVSGEAAPDEWSVRQDGALRVRGSDQAIDAAQAARIAQLAVEVAERMGAPQDIEWAIAGGTLYLLQSRPITALPEAVEWKSPEPGAFFRHFRFGEWLGDPITPLFETWLLDRLEYGLAGSFRRNAGFTVEPPYHVVVNGWYFYSMNFLPRGIRAMVVALLHLTPRLIARPRTALRAIPFAWRLTYPTAIKEWQEVVRPRHQEAVRQARARVEQAGPDELVELIESLARDAGDYFPSLMSVAGAAAKAELPLATMYPRYVEPVAGGSYLDLLQGLFTPEPGATDHAVQSLDWFHPTLGEIRLEVEPASAAQARRQRLTQARQGAEERVRQALAGQAKVSVAFERDLATAQRLQPLREEQSLDFTLGWPVMRRALARLGEALVARGIIDHPADIYFLTRDEVLVADSRLGTEARRRRSEWERRRRLTPPLAIGDVDARVKSVVDHFLGPRQGRSSDPNALIGIAASAGRVTGTARIIRRMEDFERLQSGDVLVAPATTPAWTPLFAVACAVVSDTGSLGSHSSQVAREYGIPAVVCTGDATGRLRDGQLVTVDGSAGIVTVEG